MKKLLLLTLAIVCLGACCNAPELASADFLNGTWSSTRYDVQYGFMGKNTMFISDSIEGEEYHYNIVQDTIVFRLILDEEIGDTLDYDSMTYNILDKNTIELNYHGFRNTIIRNIP